MHTVAVERTVELGRTVAVERIAELGRTAAAVERTVGLGRTVAVEAGRIADKIERRLVEPPADSFEVLPAVKFAARFPVLLELAARPGRCSSRELSAGRKLDWRIGRRPLEVALNFAACAP